MPAADEQTVVVQTSYGLVPIGWVQSAQDAHEIETLLQAAEYRAQGHDTQAWRENSAAALRTGSARQLAQAIGSANPHSWWSTFMTSNH